MSLNKLIVNNTQVTSVDEKSTSNSKNLINSNAVYQETINTVKQYKDNSSKDLNIGDEEGNVIVQFNDGHLKTKRFDSEKCSQRIDIEIDNSQANLNIGDEEGNVIVQFKDGHIKTKKFDSTNITNDDASKTKYYNKGKSYKSTGGGKKFGIVVGGQSNAYGATPISGMPQKIKDALPFTNCNLVMNDGFDATAYQQTVEKSFSPFSYEGKTNWGFDGALYYYLTTNANQTLYVMKLAEGNVSIDPQGNTPNGDHWTADYEQLDESHALIRWFEKIICNHSYNNDEFEIRAFVWHQGCADHPAGPASRYYENLKNVVNYVRGIVGNPNLPFLTATISTRSAHYSAVVKNAQIKLAEEDPNVYLIDVEDAPLCDSWHFTSDVLDWLGSKMFDLMIDIGLTNGTKINMSKPW